MKINGNVANTNPSRQYGISNENIAKTPDKRVGDYQATPKGDDVAGKSANENMRAQIHERFASSQDTQNTISQIQATDTALQEAQNTLQGMANNPANRDLTDITARMNNIAANSTFNGRTLLDSNFAESLGLRGINAGNANELANNAMERINTRRAELNAEQNRLQQQLPRPTDNRITDQNAARDLASSIKDRIANNTTNALRAQGNSIPQGVLQLVD